jgi:hypothetical protein
MWIRQQRHHRSSDSTGIQTKSAGTTEEYPPRGVIVGRPPLHIFTMKPVVRIEARGRPVIGHVNLASVGSLSQMNNFRSTRMMPYFALLYHFTRAITRNTRSPSARVRSLRRRSLLDFPPDIPQHMDVALKES